MFSQLPLLLELGEVKWSQCQKSHGYPKVNLILLLSHIMINIHEYTDVHIQRPVSLSERRQHKHMSQWQQAGGHGTALTACKLPDPLLVNTDNKGPPSHCSSAQSFCWPLPTAGEPWLCQIPWSLYLLGIQMLALLSMEKKQEGKPKRKAKPREQKLGNTFCSQPDPDFE